MSNQGGGPPPTRLQHVRAELALMLAWSTRNGRKRRTEAIRAAQRELEPLGPHNVDVPQMGKAACARARDQAQHGPTRDPGMCLSMVVDAYQVRHGIPDAIASWRMAVHKHRTDNANAIPRGWPIYWSGGSEGHGHVAIASGGGFCWSTDIKRPGRFDLVRIDRIHEQWGLDLLGWTNDLNGTEIR